MSFANIARNQPNLTRTENDAVAMNSTGSSLLDLFATIGALRQKSDFEIASEFQNAAKEDLLLAVKMAFYARNIRGGLGERRTFRAILRSLAFSQTESLAKNLKNIPVFGRWDDLYVLVSTPLELEMWALLAEQLAEDLNAMNEGKPCSVMAKWLKSANASSETTKALGRKTAKNLGLKEKSYRQILSDLRRHIDVTERKMSSGEWDRIEYSNVPSVAMKNYRKAFGRHDQERFGNFITKVETGEEKINSSTLYPYDIMLAGGLTDVYGWGSMGSGLSFNHDRVLEAQWKSLPNYVEGENNVLVMADTSGSMRGLPMATSVGLSLYFAERNKGAYNNLFLTFSERPNFVELKGSTLKERIEGIPSLNVANTNLEAAFDLILQVGLENNVPQEEMPVSLIIISDMEFDRATSGNATVTFFEDMKRKFRKAGYEMPNVVFWNAEERNKSFQAQVNDTGVQLFSGHSVSTFKNVLSSVGMTPYEAMLKTLNDPMYDCIEV